MESPDFEDILGELDVIGGDPAFLDGFDERMMMNTNEGDGWDGETDEDAYFD